MPLRILTMLGIAVVAFGLASGKGIAQSVARDARLGIEAFTQNCFSPRLTQHSAAIAFRRDSLRHDFYDLDPFTKARPSPVRTSVTPGTDRRCEVAFDGDFAADAVTAVAATLQSEGIVRDATLPAIHEDRRLPGTALLAARRLNAIKIAVVHVGTRSGPDGVETFMNVERLRAPN